MGHALGKEKKLAAEPPKKVFVPPGFHETSTVGEELRYLKFQVSVIGPPKSGKTTMFKLACTIRQYENGSRNLVVGDSAVNASVADFFRGEFDPSAPSAPFLQAFRKEFDGFMLVLNRNSLTALKEGEEFSREIDSRFSEKTPRVIIFTCWKDRKEMITLETASEWAQQKQIPFFDFSSGNESDQRASEWALHLLCGDLVAMDDPGFDYRTARRGGGTSRNIKRAR